MQRSYGAVLCRVKDRSGPRITASPPARCGDPIEGTVFAHDHLCLRLVSWPIAALQLLQGRDFAIYCHAKVSAFIRGTAVAR